MQPLNGYIDLQVNGYAGVDFNQDDLSSDDLHRCCQRLADDGTQGILATIITESTERMVRRLKQIVNLRQRDKLVEQMILGFHIEGPFISASPVFRGVHPLDAIRPADPDVMKQLLHAADGLTRIVTLAPEFDENFTVTRMLADQGLVVSGGHCDPSIEQLKAAIGSGLSMFTHVGNGCPMVMHRHDNITQRVLSLSDQLWCSFIADGAHIAYPALSNYLRLAGDERAIIITDAMTAAGLGPGRFKFSRWEVEIGDDLIVWSPDKKHLMGAAVTMKRSAENLATHLGVSEKRIQRLLSTNPWKVIQTAKTDS